MKDIALCHPRLQIKAAQLIEQCYKQSLPIQIGETLRTKEEQNALYAQGRTEPGSIVTNAKGSSYSSMHQWGIAFDFFRNDGSGAFNESGDFFQKVGEIGKSLGLEWGGDWKSIKDKPHFQLPDWGTTPLKLKTAYKTPDRFMKTWEQPAGWVKDEYGWWYRHGDGTYTVSNWEAVEGKWYWFNESGYAYKSQWVLDNGKWYYLGADNAMVTGLQIIEGNAYYFEESGAMTTVPVTLTPDESGKLH